MRLFKFRRDPTDPVDRVERYRHGRRLRSVVGLDVADDFSVIRGVAAQAIGEGKYLRLKQLASIRCPVPAELSGACRQVACGSSPTHQFLGLTSDLAALQADVVNRLRGAAHSAADSLLAVAVADPGLWSRDFDQRVLYASFCNADQLSALSGVSVIDALPAKDLVAGGHGRPLTPLACWLLLADRTSPVATFSRLVLLLDRQIEAFFLPVSDGLDDEYPQVEYATFPGQAWIERISAVDGGTSRSGTGSATGSTAHGRILEPIEGAWTDVVGRMRDRTPAEVEQALLEQTSPLARQLGASANDLAATALHWTRERLRGWLRSKLSSAREPVQVWIGGDRARHPGTWEIEAQALAGWVRSTPAFGADAAERLPSPSPEAFGPGTPLGEDDRVRSIAELGFAPEFFSAMLVAALGAMHIDQMPASLPWLTGAQTPRILGRLTPGPPHQWRTLVREMADYHPPAMRLREAV
jgi:hypothetical protein